MTYGATLARSVQFAAMQNGGRERVTSVVTCWVYQADVLQAEAAVANASVVPSMKSMLLHANTQN